MHNTDMYRYKQDRRNEKTADMKKWHDEFISDMSIIKIITAASTIILLTALAMLIGA